MAKRALGLLLGLAVLAAAMLPAYAAEPEEAVPAYTVYINGEAAFVSTAGVLDGSLYVPLRATALALRPDASADWKDGQILLTAEDFTLTAAAGTDYLAVNGRYLYLPNGVRAGESDEEVTVPVELLGYALGALPIQDDEARSVEILLPEGAKPLTPGDAYYDAAQVDLLARVIRSESGNQPLAGQIAVGNVLLNRVASPLFPATLAEVISQPGQFPGTTAQPPTAGSVLAAKLCLDGAVVLPDACWFNQTGISSWASRNKTQVAVIGGHAFYR